MLLGIWEIGTNSTFQLSNKHVKKISPAGPPEKGPADVWNPSGTQQDVGVIALLSRWIRP